MIFFCGLLNKDGFEVISSRKIIMINKKDDEHLGSSFVYNAVLLTKREIYTNIRHNGILIAKDITPVKIIKALKNLRKQIEENKISLENRTFPLIIFI